MSILEVQLIKHNYDFLFQMMMSVIWALLHATMLVQTHWDPTSAAASQGTSWMMTNTLALVR